jgi:GntR family transcriptional regulator, arabinose operon transcriptional repressor
MNVPVLKLDKQSSIPLYLQLLNWIREQILTGQWKSGTRLPTENELTLVLGISRVTVRQALGAAVDENLLVRVAGRGTFVSEKVSIVSPRKFVGYVVPTLSHSFNIQPLLGVESVIKQEGYHLIFSTSEGSLDKENLTLKQLDFEGVVGFIVSPVYDDNPERYLRQLVMRDRPVVQIDRRVEALPVDLVSVDHYGGSYAITNHLIAQGYTDILFFGREPLELSSIAERYRAYQTAIRDAGLKQRPPILIRDDMGEIDYKSIPEIVRQPRHPKIDSLIQWFSEGNLPQAIVAMNDLHALLILEAAHFAGLRVPEDIAIVGFDDLDFTASLNPPLTTVAQPPFEIGVTAAKRLLARIKGEKGPAEIISLPYRMMIRSSSITIGKCLQTADGGTG